MTCEAVEMCPHCEHENTYENWDIDKKDNTLIYDKVNKSHGMWDFKLGLGWAGYILGMFEKYMDPNDYRELLKDAIYSEEVRTIPFPELRDYQNEDVLHLLKYRVGLFSCYTGFGD